jgi:hypothetical protein
VSTGEMRSTFRHIPQAVSPPLLAHLAANAREMSRQLWVTLAAMTAGLASNAPFVRQLLHGTKTASAIE